jgi:spore germination protein GerM
MKRIIFIGIIVVIFLAGALILIRGDEDTWICKESQWIEHGKPLKPMPTELCEGNSEVFLSSPKPDETINSPFKIEGKARGFWFFEASFPIHLLDENGNELAAGIVQAQSDWMTENFIEFKGELSFVSNKEQNGKLVLEKDNPSGLPENDKKIEISVYLPKMETTKIKAYFNNSNLDPEYSCNKVFPIEREVKKTEAIARAALEELLKGTTKEEEKEGFLTSINPGVKIQKLTIDNGIAKVDFDEQLEFQVGGSCRVAAISAQIRETLKQFETVKSVIISINGRTEDILQP